MASLVVWVTVMGAAMLLLAARLGGRLPATAFVALAVALIAGDLFRAGMGQSPAIATSRATQPSTPALRYLREQRPDRFVGLERALGPSPVPPNIAMREGLYDARSYDVPVEQRYDALWRRAIRDGEPTDFPTAGAVLSARALPALRLLSVTDIVQDPDERGISVPSLPVAYEGRDARIYANPGALPRVGVVDAQRVVAGEDAELDAVLDPRFDGRRNGRHRANAARASLPRRAGEAPGAPGSCATSRRGGWSSRRRHGDRAELVLTDLHYPGWKATLDGEQADVHRVNWLLRGTTLPHGRHTVELRYEPASWRVGWIVSLASLLGLAVALAVGLSGRRRWGSG